MRNEVPTAARPLTAAEAAEYAGLPTHKVAVTVEVNTDGRATLGRAHTVHLAEVTTWKNAYGESVGRSAWVSCGSRRYRNAGGKAQPTVQSGRYDVDCAKCLAR